MGSLGRVVVPKPHAGPKPKESRHQHFSKLGVAAASSSTSQSPQSVYPTLNVIGVKLNRSTDGGFGVMQLTVPPPTYNQIWHWQRNIDEGVRRTDEKLTGARNWLCSKLNCTSPTGEQPTPFQLRMEVYARYNGLGLDPIGHLGKKARKKVGTVERESAAIARGPYPFFRWNKDEGEWEPRIKEEHRRRVQGGIRYAYDAESNERNLPPDFN